jgi:2-phospho-L-lactate guanylyltransferase
VKKLSKSKTRLSFVLTQQEREIFSLTMLEDVLGAVKNSILAHIVVIGSDRAVQTLATNYGASYVEDVSNGLNSAIKQAIKWCNLNKADSVLILPADIPLILAEDINHIFRLANRNNSLVISPSRTGGTNALFLNPPDLIPPNFGSKSFLKHKTAAKNKGTITIYQSKRVSFDIDSPKDLISLHKTQFQTKSIGFLDKINIQDRI